MKCRILLRPAAESDLDNQAGYLAEHRTLQMGLRFLRAARETFRLLASQPEMGARPEFRSSFLNDMRMFPVKGFPNYLVFYRRVRKSIEIIRVLHGARDIETLFEHRAEDGVDPNGFDKNGEVT